MKGFIFLLLVIPSFVNATSAKEVFGKISSMRTSSGYHESINAGNLEVIFKIDSGHSDCQWLGIKSSDETFTSLLIASQVQGNQIRVWYYPTKKSPLWSNVCQAITIETK